MRKKKSQLYSDSYHLEVCDSTITEIPFWQWSKPKSNYNQTLRPREMQKWSQPLVYEITIYDRVRAAEQLQFYRSSEQGVDSETVNQIDEQMVVPIAIGITRVYFFRHSINHALVVSPETRPWRTRANDHTWLILGLCQANERRCYFVKRRISLAERKRRSSPVIADSLKLLIIRFIGWKLFIIRCIRVACLASTPGWRRSWCCRPHRLGHGKP